MAIDAIGSINASKLAWGIAALAVNLGSRFVVQDMTPLQERVLSHMLFRRLVLFSIVFMATRDLLMSAGITVAAFILLDHLLDERSRYCLAPGVCGRPGTSRHTPAPSSTITRQMYMSAIDTIRRFHLQGPTKAGPNSDRK